MSAVFSDFTNLFLLAVQATCRLHLHPIFCMQLTLNLCRHRNNKSKVVKLATVVEGDPKAPFLIALTLRCRGECYSFPWIAPLYPWYMRYQVPFFKKFLVWVNLGLNPSLPDHWRILYPPMSWDKKSLKFNGGRKKAS